MKKMLAALLCAIMVMALLPATALAVEDISTTGLDLSSAPTVKTTYQAGSGTVVWDPVTSGGSVSGGTLTLDSAQIRLASFDITDRFFTLPDVPVKIELKGTSTFSTSDGGTGTVPNDASFFLATDSVELTGSGSIDSTTGRCFISTDGTVTLSGGTFSGEIKAGSAVLNDVTISEDRTLNLKDVSGQVTATNTVNNGTLVMKRKADTNADIAAIEALDLTGSGIVRMSDDTSNYYTNGGTVIPTIGGLLDFSLPSDAGGNWTYDATLEDNGYEFTGNSTTGYTLKLGNLIIDTYDFKFAITLPKDGPVNVILADGATTRINTYGGGAIFFGTTGDTYPCTITGNGKLVLNGSSPYLIRVCQPLTITGGDITIKNVPHPTMGIAADGAELTIIGGRLSIAAATSAIYADKLTLINAKITSPEGAMFSSTSKTICDANGNAVASVTIEPIIVKSVMVNPASVSIQKGGTQTFNATVTGQNGPAQTVTWTVEGGVAGTSIDEDGVLTVAADETATTLTVKATSTVDTAKSGAATVTVTTPPTEYEMIKGQDGEWTKGSANDLGFTADADYAEFTGVSVDGTALSGDKYTSESGSTIVTLKASYLETLANGQHTFRVNFTNGYAETSFTVKAAATNPDNSDTPATGDNSQPMLWLGMTLLAGAGLAASFVIGRRKIKNG